MRKNHMEKYVKSTQETDSTVKVLLLDAGSAIVQRFLNNTGAIISRSCDTKQISLSMFTLICFVLSAIRIYLIRLKGNLLD